MFFQCTREENELGLTNACHRHCKCPYFCISKCAFHSSSPTQNGLTPFPRGQPRDPTCTESNSASRIPGGPHHLQRGVAPHSKVTYELKGQVISPDSHTMCNGETGQISHADTSSEKKGNWEMLRRHWPVQF